MTISESQNLTRSEPAQRQIRMSRITTAVVLTFGCGPAPLRRGRRSGEPAAV
jgi:hypothetical protein